MAADQYGQGEKDVAWTREAAEAWHRAAEARSQYLGQATEAMLDLAGIDVGSRVLDVAAGTGDQALLAARRVGPTGSVLAIDVAPNMLEIAADVVRQAGIANVETRLMDAQHLDLESDSFDAAICRAGLMHIPDVRRALGEIRRALKPGGKLAALVYSTQESNPYLALPIAIARRCGVLSSPLPDQPGHFALGDPDLLERVYREAGFLEVSVRPVPILRRFPSLADAVSNLRETPPPTLRKLMASLSDTQRDQAWTEIHLALRQFDGPAGFEVPGELLLGVGRKG